jgi:RNase H-fold protein (predicted Holliday junction resolvase)
MNRVLAIDPGTVRCGLAVVREGSDRPLYRVVVPRRELEPIVRELVTLFAPSQVLLGRGTASASVIGGLERGGLAVELVDERGSTLAARTRYYRAYPPRGWWRLIPAGLLLPRGPIDDWAAVVIAERYLTKVSSRRVE